MGSLKQQPFTKINDITFRIYSDEEIEKISVLHVTNEESINSLGHYLKDGIYDLHMGPMSVTDDELCKTCFSKSMKCSGHCGHINLPLPIFNPFFIDIIRQLLSRICHECHRFQATPSRALQFIYECKLAAEGYTVEALEISSLISSFKGDEATEVHVRVDDKENNRKSFRKTKNQITESVPETVALQKKLMKYYNSVKEGRSGDGSSTCNSQAVAQHVLKNFYYDTRLSRKAECCFCSSRILHLGFQNSQLTIKNSAKIIDGNERNSSGKASVVKTSQPYLTAEQAQSILRGCWDKDGTLLKHMYPVFDRSDMQYPTDLLFIRKLVVIPPKYRPCNILRAGLIENDMSVLYKNVLKLTKCVRFLVLYKEESIETLPDTVTFLIKEFAGGSITEKCHTILHELQRTVNSIYDSELGTKLTASAKGIRQVIEKKYGLFRQNLMGKRVNFSARSVAAPDPVLGIDEIGVPRDFAMRLTYPAYVFPHNVKVLREQVINGPNKYPGAVMVEDEEGKKVMLKAADEQQRIAIANSLLTAAESCVNKVNLTKIVYRHLQNGDFVLMNRQPTLHKPSIQAHKARVMPKDRVLRMPYANCKAYNADFDGDELNLHFPQNELARSESQQLVTTHNQYLTPRDGSPLAGLIQDSVVAAVMLTMRGKFFTKEDYQQLVYVAVSERKGKLVMLPPSIVKPKMLWSGKQVVSTILLNHIPEDKAKVNLKFKAAVRVELWEKQEPRVWLGRGEPEKNKESMTETELIVRDGELLCGVIDKNSIGSKSHGLIHTCYDLYGGAIASNILTSINRLCVWYLQWSGHTIGLHEFATSVQVSQMRREFLKDLMQGAGALVSKKLNIAEKDLPSYTERQHVLGNDKEIAAIDEAYTSVLSRPTSSIIMENEKRLYRSSLNNRMRMMIDTGAKGSRVNMNQMASLFGSVALDGKRMPMSITGRTLPSFKPYECSPKAGGYIPTRFFTGMDPQSYFFLCIVGRDSLQHTAVKTANSGYMQRCLIKHLEGIVVKYDGTVRNSDNVVLQYSYGEDGLDVVKIPFLKNKDTLDTLVENYSRLIKKDEDIKYLDQDELQQIQKYKKRIWKQQEKHRHQPKIRSSGFLKYSKERREHLNQKPYTEGGFSVLAKMWHQMTNEERQSYERSRCPDPVSAVFHNSRQLGVVSEALDRLIDEYYVESYHCRPLAEQKLSKKQVTYTVHKKAFHSRVDAGEPVGALCAQAIGEPLTQMTLNTFHFAGRDELNVTLGVPRMIEILRTASENISTPIMEVPFLPGTSRSIAQKLKNLLTPVQLSQVVHRVHVTGCLEKSFKLYRNTTIRFEFLPYNEYKKAFPVTPQLILGYMESTYFKKVLIKEILKALQKADNSGASFRSYKKEFGGKEDDEEEKEKSLIAVNEAELENKDELTSDEEDIATQADDLDVGSSARLSKKQERDYSDEEEEEMNDSKEESDDEEETQGKVENQYEDEGFFEERSSEGDEAKNTSQTREVLQKKKKKKKETGLSSEKDCKVNEVIQMDDWIADYDFDDNKNEWCQVTLCLPIAEGKYDLGSILRSTIENSLIHSVPNIKKAYVEEEEGSFMLRTEGVNITKMYSFENYLDVRRIYSNNIHFMVKNFGIEAGQRSIIREIRAVQEAYDIKVDFRHLSLLADYFTCEGTYKACSRFALGTCASPIQKMSYETFFSFLKEATLQGHSDSMSSPSANVMVGQPVKVGTNSDFNLMVKVGCGSRSK